MRAYLERKKNPDLYPKPTPQERMVRRREKQLEYYRRRRGLPLDYVPSYRAPVLKKCDNCEEKHDRPRANLCQNCQKKITYKKNYEWQKKYRKKNPGIIEQRIKRSQNKNPELYKSLQRKHYLKRYGLPVDHIFKEKRKAGSGSISKQGYKRIPMPLHPNSQANGQILEHVYVMAQHLGRPLQDHETVHHKNGDRLDNRLENLELWNRSHPPGQRVEDKIKWCKEFLEIYGCKVTLSDP